MKKMFTSIKFLWQYTKQYKLILFIVMIFMIAATYFQVLGPKLLGDSIDEMSSYVTAEIAKKSMDEFNQKLSSGQGLTQEEKKNLIDNSKFDEKTKTLITNADGEQLKQYYDNQQFIKEIINVDPASIENLQGLSQKQKDAISNSSTSQMNKQIILSMTKEQLQTTQKQIQDSTITSEDIAQKHKAFIRGIIKLILSFVFLTIGMLIYNVLVVTISAKSTRNLRRGLFGKIEELSIRFFDKSNDGDLLSRFTNDIDNISSAMNQSLVQIVSQIVMLFAIVIMMFVDDTSTVVIKGITINNILVWSMIFLAVIAIVMSLFIAKKAQFYVSRQQAKLGELNGYIDERISGQKVIISYGLEEQTIDGFIKYNDDLKDISIKGQVYSGILMPFVNGVGLINLGILVFLGSIFVSTGNMSVGLLVTFIGYSQQFFQPLAQIVSQYNMVELASTGAIRVKEIIDEKPEVINKPNAVDIEAINGEIELIDVNFSYDPGRPILNDINIKVKKGQMIALVGPTGSGKTTVMNLMNRFYDIDSGQILFDGKNITEITLETLRKNVGIVLQESVLFSGTIADNIAYGKDDATKEEIINAAKTANIHDFIMTLEQGYETKVNNNTSMFSTGQKQLMSIARTILTDPDLLILDEATSNVDTVTEAKIQKAMENVLKGRTSFVIAHRLKTILNADEIIVLKDGIIIEKGPHNKLLEEDGFYAELYKNQFVIE